MADKQDTPVIIERTSNGYIIRPANDRFGEFTPITDWLSFESFEGVIGWLSTHYSRPAPRILDETTTVHAQGASNDK